MGQPQPFPKPGRDAERELANLHSRFAAVSRRVDREREITWYQRHWKALIAAITVTGLGGWHLAEVGPKTAWAEARHLLAASNCIAARGVGLAPSQKGQPGYWPKHDADNDGIACEPWPR